MTRTHVTLAAIPLAATAVLVATSMSADESPGPAVDSLVKGNTAFAVELYRELGGSEGNLFFSPYSISSALGMTYAGARGNTAAEMEEALHFELDQTQLHPAFKSLNRALARNARKADQKLNIANGLCLTGGDVSKDFKKLLQKNYDAELFSGGLDKINGWVRKKTEGKIEKILDALAPNSVCVLLNAIYFKGTWESQFRTRLTRDAPFKVSADRQVTVPLMYQRGEFQLLEKQDFQAASILYKGKRLSMIILLPRAVDGLGRLEEQLTEQSLRQWLAELDKAPAPEIELFIPKYRLETDYDLAPPCQALGMKDAFDSSGNADISAMGGRKGELYITQIKHRAFVEVNEEGTEAAAATGVGIGIASVPTYPVFRADHPFLFLIRDNQAGSILFMGRMVDPDSK